MCCAIQSPKSTLRQPPKLVMPVLISKIPGSAITVAGIFYLFCNVNEGQGRRSERFNGYMRNDTQASGVSDAKERVHIFKIFELKGIPSRIEQEERALFTRLAGKPYARFDNEV